jgi:hypothetical protein
MIKFDWTINYDRPDVHYGMLNGNRVALVMPEPGTEDEYYYEYKTPGGKMVVSRGASFNCMQDALDCVEEAIEDSILCALDLVLPGDGSGT